jgi:hypothetical protein
MKTDLAIKIEAYRISNALGVTPIKEIILDKKTTIDLTNGVP